MSLNFFIHIWQNLKNKYLKNHNYHWTCLILIWLICFAGNCYQIYLATSDLIHYVSDIDIEFSSNYSLPSITICLPIFPLLDGICLYRKKPVYINKLQKDYNYPIDSLLFKRIYLKIKHDRNIEKDILRNFFFYQINDCLIKPDFYTNELSLTEVKLLKYSFKSEFFCTTLFLNRSYITKEEIILNSLTKSFLEVVLDFELIRYIDYVKIFTHDAQDTQIDLLLWFYVLIDINIDKPNYKNIFMFSYEYYINLVENNCLKNDEIISPYDNQISSTFQLKEECLNREILRRLNIPFGESSVTINLLKQFEYKKIKLFLPDFKTFNTSSLINLVEKCYKLFKLKECTIKTYVPKLENSFKDNDKDLHLIFKAPTEPDLEVKSTQKLSNFEFFIYISSVVCCWLQFSVFGFVYSLFQIQKKIFSKKKS